MSWSLPLPVWLPSVPAAAFSDSAAAEAFLRRRRTIQIRTARRAPARVAETEIPAMAPVEIIGGESGVGEGPAGIDDAVLDGTGRPGRGVNADPDPDSGAVAEFDGTDDCVVEDDDNTVDDVLDDDDDEGPSVTVDTLPLSEMVAVTTTAGWNKSSYWMLHRTNSSVASYWSEQLVRRGQQALETPFLRLVQGTALGSSQEEAWST